MTRPLNLANMTDYPEAENNPWSDLLWGNGDCAVAAYAAHDAITSLSRSWNVDWADWDESHRFVLLTVEETIKALTNYYWALHLMVEHERLREENGELAERVEAGTASPADFVALGKRLEAMNDLKKKVGIKNEKYAALLKSAFAPAAERGAS